MCWQKKVAFTLAEVLITIVIIGIVAAMTMPVLINTINEIVKENQITVFERKFGKGVDLLNIDNGIGPYYSNSEEFVRRLAEHLKIVTICDKDNLKKCLPYETIQQTDKDPFKVDEITTESLTGINSDDYLDVAGMVLADGTPMVLAFKKDCPVSDPDKVEYSGQGKGARSSNTQCIAGFYDINGSKAPNRFGKDIVGFNGILGLKEAGIKIAGITILKAPFGPSPLYYADYCQNDQPNAEASAAGIQLCYRNAKNSPYNPDRWASAMIECYRLGGRLPNSEELATLAAYFYDLDGLGAEGRINGRNINSEKVANSPFSSSLNFLDTNRQVTFWTNYSINYSYSNNAYVRSFKKNWSEQSYYERNSYSGISSATMAFCVK